MSIFWIGNEHDMVPPDRLLPEMWEDRYFLPGTLHGDDDYVIRVYLNDAHGECPACNDHDQFEAEYIDRDLILKAAEEDPSYGDIFNDVIAEGLESFGIPNDGDHDFNEIFKAWEESVPLTNEELVYWAEGKMRYIISNIDWEVDEADDLASLPKTVCIADYIEEEDIADYLSDKYGFLLKGFRIKWKKEA